MQKASKWCDQKLPQKNTLVRPAIPILDIPVDEDIQKQPCPEHLHSVPKVLRYASALPLIIMLCCSHVLHWHVIASALLLASPPVPAMLSGEVHACLACCTQGTLRQRLERTAGSAMEERLLKDPLRYHKNKH